MRAERLASITGSIRMMFASYQSVFFRCFLPYVVSAVSYMMSRRVFQLSSALSVSIPESAILIDSMNCLFFSGYVVLLMLISIWPFCLE